MSNINKHYIYVLKLVPRLIIKSNWTKDDEEIVDRHFEYLKELLRAGKLLLAGKTSGLDDRTFGIVILEVDSEKEAKDIMEKDPSVIEGVMMAELFPYDVALLKR